MDEGTKKYSFDHIFAGSNPSVLIDKTKSAGDGLKTAHTDSGANDESRVDDISLKVKLEDLSDILNDTISSFFTPDSPPDEPIVVSDESEEEEEVAKDKVTKATSHDIPKDTLVPPPSSLKLAQIQELMAQIKDLKKHVRDMEIELPGDLKEILTKLETFTSTISSLSSQVAELHNIQWELPANFLNFPSQVSSVQEKLKTLDSLPSLLHKDTDTLNRFSTMVENAFEATSLNVPLVGKATALPTKREKNTKDAETNLQK
ncbi:hypothetical protein Tco_0451590 [Tanacetum coccineum]